MHTHTYTLNMHTCTHNTHIHTGLDTPMDCPAPQGSQHIGTKRRIFYVFSDTCDVAHAVAFNWILRCGVPTHLVRASRGTHLFQNMCKLYIRFRNMYKLYIRFKNMYKLCIHFKIMYGRSLSLQKYVWPFTFTPKICMAQYVWYVISTYAASLIILFVMYNLYVHFINMYDTLYPHMRRPYSFCSLYITCMSTL
jgi:hypothetical protein